MMHSDAIQAGGGVIGPEPYRVYQRNEDGWADIEFSVNFSKPVHGMIEIRAIISSGTAEWQQIGIVDGDAISGIFQKLSVGTYCLEIRVAAKAPYRTLFSAKVEPVHVGDLWILAGQSNMEGCGKLVDIELPQEGISCYYLGDRWGLAEEPLYWPNESIDPVYWNVSEEKRVETIRSARRDLDSGAGLGLTFGKEVYRQTGVPVGLVICARGGTAMDQWDPALITEEGKSIYGAMIRRVNMLGGKVKGCLWFQGESDATEDAAPMYAEKMRRWVHSLRQDISAPHLLFIYAQISRQHRCTRFPIFDSLACCWNRIQEEQRNLEAELQPAALVPTIDSTLSDVGHLDAASQKNVGRRMAWRALELAYGRTVAAIGPRPACYEWNGNRTELTISIAGINGGLEPVGKVYGFYAESDDGKEPFTAVLTSDRKQVLLYFERSIPGNCRLWHGRGTNPTVNIRDEKGIPLLVFGPVQV